MMAEEECDFGLVVEADGFFSEEPGDETRQRNPCLYSTKSTLAVYHQAGWKWDNYRVAMKSLGQNAVTKCGYLEYCYPAIGWTF